MTLRATSCGLAKGQSDELLATHVIDDGLNLLNVFLRELQHALKRRQVANVKRVSEPQVASFGAVASLEDDRSKVATGLTLVSKHGGRDVAEAKRLLGGLGVGVLLRHSERGKSTPPFCRVATWCARTSRASPWLPKTAKFIAEMAGPCLSGRLPGDLADRVRA